MKRLVLVLALQLSLGLPATAAATATPATSEPVVAVTLAAPGAAIRDAYIVTLRAGGDARAVARAAGVAPRFVYDAALTGFAASLTPRQLAGVRRTAGVVAVEEDAVVRADGTQSFPTYGLDRIDQRFLPLSSSYTYNDRAGAGVTAYVIDTGIDTTHLDFGGRARQVYPSEDPPQDCNGHGTHVAGTIGSTTYGVAKLVQLRGMRVLDCQGNGSFSGIIAALDWLRTNAVRPAVANMSLGGGFSKSANDATTNLVNSGVVVVVAAGNSNANACQTSPASAREVLTIAASTRTDTRASYSNHGRCVELYAPGSSITSTWLNNSIRTMSGTSMAAPHVAGVAALYMAVHAVNSASEVNNAIITSATTGVIQSNRNNTPNRLLFTNGL